MSGVARLGEGGFFVVGVPMSEFLILIRNVIIAGILAWLGLDAATDDHDQPDAAPESAIAAFFGG